jgi:hypothetical protein
MITCAFCDKRVHEVGWCWKNPDDPHNRLDSSSGARSSRINKHKKNAAKVAKASKSAARASKAYKAIKRPDSSSNYSSSLDENSDARRFRLNTAHAVSSALRADAAQQSSRIILDSGESTQMYPQERSAPYAPKAKGISERAGCTIFEMGRTTIFKSGLPKSFWAEAVSNAAAIHNRHPQAGGMSPFEKLYGRKPSVNKFRPFIRLAYVFKHRSKCKNLDSKSIPCILITTTTTTTTLEHGNYRV